MAVLFACSGPARAGCSAWQERQAERLPCFARRTVNSRVWLARRSVLLSIPALAFNLLLLRHLKIARSLMLMKPFLPWQSMQAV